MQIAMSASNPVATRYVVTSAFCARMAFSISSSAIIKFFFFCQKMFFQHLLNQKGLCIRKHNSLPHDAAYWVLFLLDQSGGHEHRFRKSHLQHKPRLNRSVCVISHASLLHRVPCGVSSNKIPFLSTNHEFRRFGQNHDCFLLDFVLRSIVQSLHLITLLL